MTGTTVPTIVIVPGMREHVEDHWQTILAERLGDAGRTVRTVPRWCATGSAATPMSPTWSR